MKTVSVPTDWLNEITGRTVANAITYLSTLPSDHELNYWQDVGDDHGVEIRSELLCHRPYTEQAEVTDGIRPEDFTVDVVVKPMGGFAPVNTQGVRVTHKPTGISVTCDAARSQHMNRQQAFEKLRAILALRPERVLVADLPEGDVTYFNGRGDAVDGYTAERVWEILRSHGITAHAKKETP